MASLLSEASSFSLYDKGHKSFRSSVSPYDIKLPLANLNEILAQKNPQKDIQKLEPQVLYFSLKNQGIRDYADVLKFISKEQLVKIFDYDVWNQDGLAPNKAFLWLDTMRQLDPELMLNRYRELDEEYQIALISQNVKAFGEEEFELMTESEQDSLYHLPGNQIYYSINGLDKETHESLIRFIETAAERDIEYAVSLLGHVSFLPPNETEQTISRFRKARLEEDGFVTYEEGRSFFRPLDLKKYARNLEKSSADFEKISDEPALMTLEKDQSFFEKAMAHAEEAYPEKREQRQKDLLLLINGLMSAVEVEHDSLSEIKQLMRITRSCLSFSLEKLASKNVSLAAYLLSEKCHLKDLFSFYVSSMHEVKANFLNKLEAQTGPNLDKYRSDLNSLKYGTLLDRFDKDFREILGFEQTELVKAFFNRFSLCLEKSEEKNPSTLFFAPISSEADLKSAILDLELCLKEIQYNKSV